MSRRSESGFHADGATIRLPGPILKDGLDAGQQHAALLKLSGSERALADLLRDSVTAPFLLKVRDQKTTDATVRMVDLWFVVRGDLDESRPGRGGTSKPAARRSRPGTCDSRAGC